MLNRLILGALFSLTVSAAAAATPVGERHLTTSEPSAAIRDARHRADLRITVWYPEGASSTIHEFLQTEKLLKFYQFVDCLGVMRSYFPLDQSSPRYETGRATLKYASCSRHCLYR